MNSQEALKEALEIKNCFNGVRNIDCDCEKCNKSKQKLQQLADEHKFEGGCGKFIYHYNGKGNVHCQENYLCKNCQAKKIIQEIKKEVLG